MRRLAIRNGLGQSLLISIHTHLIYSVSEPCDLLLQVEAVQGGCQTCDGAGLVLQAGVESLSVSGEDGIGVRRWIRVDDTFECRYSAQVKVDRQDVVLDALDACPKSQLPSDVVKFLMPSRYCFPEDFLECVPAYFGALSGGSLVAAMTRWIQDSFTYDNEASSSSTTATDSFAIRAGVCRDYAHVLIAMARSVGIPARFVGAYAPDVVPQDFHAVAEVFLGGAWHLVDATGMARASDIVRIGVGRDAADVSFMTSYGWMELKKQSIEVSRVD